MGRYLLCAVAADLKAQFLNEQGVFLANIWTKTTFFGFEEYYLL